MLISWCDPKQWAWMTYLATQVSSKLYYSFTNDSTSCCQHCQSWPRWFLFISLLTVCFTFFPLIPLSPLSSTHHSITTRLNTASFCFEFSLSPQEIIPSLVLGFHLHGQISKLWSYLKVISWSGPLDQLLAATYETFSLAGQTVLHLPFVSSQCTQHNTSHTEQYTHVCVNVILPCRPSKRLEALGAVSGRLLSVMHTLWTTLHHQFVHHSLPDPLYWVESLLLLSDIVGY